MKIDRNAPIGVFDSGVGGLTVAREIMRNLPMEKIVYFGDTARVPYGSKSKETVLRYSRQIVRFLQKQGVKAIVIACNTASALALDTLEKEIDIPIIGVVKPGAKVAARETTKKRVGVIATEATINSHLYKELIQQIDPEITVIGKPCPLFVPLVEEGWRKDPVTEIVARRYLNPDPWLHPLSIASRRDRRHHGRSGTAGKPGIRDFTGIKTAADRKRPVKSGIRGRRISIPLLCKRCSRKIQKLCKLHSPLRCGDDKTGKSGGIKR